MQQPNAVKWFTQPPGALASFYYYEPASKKLVRIRMELKRDDQPPYTPNTGVFLQTDRYVGFFDKNNAATNIDPDTPGNLFTTNAQGAIVFNGKILAADPVVGFEVCDFSGAVPNAQTLVHVGNPVADANAAAKPPGIDIATLSLVAQNAIAANKGKDLTGPNATEQEVADALKKLTQLSNF